MQEKINGRKVRLYGVMRVLHADDTDDTVRSSGPA